MTTTSAPSLPLSSSPCLPIALPPSSRDFEIFEQNQIDFLSTRRVAEQHRISQTRVRQIVTRVANWLAAHLPAKTEAEKEADIRLAQHLAAAQLRRQIEQCQNYFDGSGDPKYLRHQTRIILALARLGIIPGEIDCLAADLSDDSVGWAPPTTPTRSDSEGPASQAHDRGAGLRPASNVGCISAAQCTTTPDLCHLTPAPSAGACSPSPPPQPETHSTASTPPAATRGDDEPSGDTTLDPQTTLQGLAIMERRLLTLLDETPTSNHDRRSSLTESLAEVRRNQAIFQLRLSPAHPGAETTTGKQGRVHDHRDMHHTDSQLAAAR